MQSRGYDESETEGRIGNTTLRRGETDRPGPHNYSESLPAKNKAKTYDYQIIPS